MKVFSSLKNNKVDLSGLFIFNGLKRIIGVPGSQPFHALETHAKQKYPNGKNHSSWNLLQL